MLAQAYYRTYDLPVIIARPCNNYGPWQYPEKLVPVVIKKAIRNEKVPIYARGLNMREWLYVSDCARALFSILEKGKVGEIYNVGSGQERKNIDTAGLILDVLGKSHGLIEFVKDRPGHDLRYSLDSKKIKQHTGWSAKVKFETGIKETVAWYTGNSRWLFDADSGEKFKRRGILKLMGSNCWQGNSAQMRRGRF
jgi:dTDP-glucose 4,6-dehydratase